MNGFNDNINEIMIVSPVFLALAWTSIRAFLFGALHRILSIWHFRVRVTLCAFHFAFAPILCFVNEVKLIN